jgi:hypothetical protein
MKVLIPQPLIGQRIFVLRGRKVMIDRDLAELYGVSTKVLNQAVKRNIERFPEEFMFRLTNSEKDELVTICDRLSMLKHATVTPQVFTEHGVAMFASVLKSKKAVKISISIIKTFIKLRQILSTHKELAYKLAELERKTEKHDDAIKVIFEAIRELMMPQEEKPRRRTGFYVG